MRLPRLLRSVLPGAGLGAVPVVACVVVVAGAAGVLDGVGVVTLPVGTSDAPIVLRPESRVASRALVARGDRDAIRLAAGRPDRAARSGRSTQDGPRSGARALSQAATVSPVATVGRPSGSPGATAPGASSVSRPPSSSAPSAPSASGAPSASVPTTTTPARRPVVGDAVKGLTSGLAADTSNTTHGLAQALGGSGTPVGGLVDGLGGRLNETVHGLGDTLGALLGSPRG